MNRLNRLIRRLECLVTRTCTVDWPHWYMTGAHQCTNCEHPMVVDIVKPTIASTHPDSGD